MSLLNNQNGTKNLAIKVFKEEAAAMNWLASENLALGGVRPIDMMQTEAGNASVRRLLLTIVTRGGV